jgi:hypothetical protein
MVELAQLPCAQETPVMKKFMDLRAQQCAAAA